MKPNLVFFIGDGMGVNQMHLASLVNEGLLCMEAMPVVGLVKNQCVDSVVPDSCASGTSLASGLKTKISHIGLDANEKPVSGLLDILKSKGYTTGLISTARVTSVTPACFYGQVKGRREEENLVNQLIKSKIDLILGGGAVRFRTPEMTRLFIEGYEVATEWQAINWTSNKIIATLAEEFLPLEIDGWTRKEGTTLSNWVRESLKFLRSKRKPFVLVIESANIDHACHLHDAGSVLREVQALDKAVEVALNDSKKNADTTVIVTGDHSTGGLSISEMLSVEGLLAQKTSVVQMLPEWPCTNNELAARIFESSKQNPGEKELDRILSFSSNYNNRMALGNWLSRKNGVYFFPVNDQINSFSKTRGHDASSIPVFVSGKNAALFGGCYHQSQIFFKIKKCLEIE